MKKKFYVLLLGVIAALTLTLTGCFGSGSGSGSGSGGGSTNPPAPSFISVSTVEELQSLANKSGSYKLANDIDISGNEWTPIDGFTGTLDGDGKTISGLTISGNKANIGLFSTLKGTVKNLKITGVNITGTGDAGTAGAVCGTNEGTVNGVTVAGSINAPYYSNVGGIAGISNHNLVNCKNNVVVNAYDNVGGIAGTIRIANGATCSGSINEATISGKSSVGGIAGVLETKSPGGRNTGNSTFVNQVNKGNISGSSDNVGGIIGTNIGEAYNYYGDLYYTKVTVSSCTNSGIINGKNNTGGIVGKGSCIILISACTNSANITGNNYVGSFAGYVANTEIKLAINNNDVTGKGYLGGIAGYAGDLNDCTNNGQVLSTAVIIEEGISLANVGGIAGYATGLKNCTNNTDITITSQGENVGGLVGVLFARKNSSIINNVNSGRISGYSNVGGIAGKLITGTPGERSSGTVSFENNENSNMINGQNNKVGGLIGYQTGQAYNYYGDLYYTYLMLNTNTNSGLVNGNDYTGGLIGLGDFISRITSCSNSADVTGGNYVGGYAGKAQNSEFRILTNNNVITGKAYIGGISGYGGAFDNCNNNGEIISLAVLVENSISVAYVGGISGYAIGLKNSSNKADINVTTTGCYVAGLVGYLRTSRDVSVESNVNDGAISGENYVGGIVGCYKVGDPGGRSNGNAYFSDNENKKSVTGRLAYTGGLIGYATSDYYNYYGDKYYSYLTISNCTNSGNISGNNYSGGIIAYGEYVKTDSNIWATNTNSGTISGSNKGDKYGYLK